MPLDLAGDVQARGARPELALVRTCDSVAADFSALTDEWEALLADAALDGQVVFQVKPLMESLTGRVEIDHLSENSFGYLVPMRAYAYLKDVADWLFALLVAPIVFPLMALMVGWLAERGWTGDNIVRSFTAHLAANIFCLALGGLYLASLIGAEKGWLLGVAPFILGGVLKSALAAAVLKGIRIYGGRA